MQTFIKKLYFSFFGNLVRRIKLALNRTGNNKKCNVCNRTFNHFSKYDGGSKKTSEWMQKLEMVGSDVDNFGCEFCDSFDRERHLFMYFDKLKLWDSLKDFEILHFAPEFHLNKKIEQYSPVNYIKADLFPSENTIQKIDATAIPYNGASFDLVICNHVLEHIPDYMQAQKEIFRVLKPNGIAILQTPFSRLLINNFEDPGINTDSLRLFFLRPGRSCKSIQ